MSFGGPVASLFVEFGADTKKFESGLSNVEGGLGKVSSGIGSVISTAGGFALAQAGIGGFSTAIDSVVGGATAFDGAMRNVNTLVGLAPDQFSALESGVLGVSKAMGTDATANANALYQAISAGVPQDNLITFLETSSKAAIGGSAELSTVVGATASVIKGYGDTFDDAGHVQDLFFQTVKDGVTTMPELASSIGSVAPLANSAGVSVEELMASFSTLTGVTGNTSEVATQLKGALTSVIKPSSEASDMAKEMGIDFSVTGLKSKGLAGFMQEVGAKSSEFASTHGMATVDVLGKMFGSVEGLNAVLALTGSQQDNFATKLDNMNNAAGNSQAAFDEMNKSFGRQMDIAKGKLTIFATQVGMVLLPVAMKLGGYVSGGLSAAFGFLSGILSGPVHTAFVFIRDAFLTFKQAISGDWANADGIEPLHAAIGNIGLTIRNVVIPAIMTVATAVAGFVTTALPYLQQFGGWFVNVAIPAYMQFALKFNELIVQGVIAGVTAFVSFALPYLQTFADWFIGTALPALQNFATQAQTFFTGVLLPAVTTFVDTVLPKLQEFGAWIVAQIPTAQELGTMLTNAFTQISTSVGTAVNTILPLLIAVGGAIVDGLLPIIPQLVAMWETLSANFTSTAPIVQSLQNLFTQLKPALEAIAIVFGVILVAAIGMAVSSLGGLAGFLNGALPGAIQVVTGAINVVSGVLQVFSSLVIGIVKIVSDLLHGDFSGAWQDAQAMVSGVAQGIGQILSGLKDIVIGAITGLVNGVIGLITGFVSSFIGYFQHLYDVIVGHSIIPDLVSEIISVISGLPGAVLGFITGMVTDAISAFTGFATDALSAAGTLVTDVTSKIGELVTNVPGKILDMATSGIEKLGTFVSDATTKGAELVTQVVNKVADIVTQVPGKIVEMATQGVLELGTFVTNAVAKVGELPGLALSALGDLTGVLSGAGKDLIQGFIGGITGMFGSVESTLGGLTSKLTSWKGPPEKDATLLTESGRLVIEGFIAGLRDLFPDAQITLENFTDKFGDTGVKAMADAMSAMFGAVKTGVDALNSLANFVAPTSEGIKAFTDAVTLSVRAFADSAALFSTETLDSAKAFADTAKPVVDMIGAGVQSLTALATFVRPTDESISDFKFSLEHLVRSIADSAAVFATDALKGAALFGESAKSVLDSVSVGAEALTKLNEFVRPSDDSISEFKFSVEHLVRSIADSAAMFSKDAIAAAKQYADTAGAVLDMLGTGVTALAGLGTLVLPTDESLSAFKFSVEHLVRSIADSAAMFTTDALTQAQAFASAAAPILDLLKSGVEGFAALVAPTKGGGDLQSATDTFVASVQYLVSGIATAAMAFAKDALDQAKAFAESAGPVLDLLSKGSDFSDIEKFTAPAEEDIDAFVAFTDLAVSKFVDASKSFDKDGLAAAQDYLSAAGSILDVLGKGTDTVASLAGFEYTDAVAEGLDRWLAFVALGVNKLGEAAGTFDADGLAAAGAYADAAGKVLDVIGKASDFSALSEYGSGMTTNLDSYFADVKTAVQMLIDLDTELAGGLDTAAAVAAKIADIVDLLTPDNTSAPSSGSGGDSSTPPATSTDDALNNVAPGGGFGGFGTYDPKKNPGAFINTGNGYTQIGTSGKSVFDLASQGAASTTTPVVEQHVSVYLDSEDVTERTLKKVATQLKQQGVYS